MIPVAFDLRDPVRSGLARVAVGLARAFAKRSSGEFAVTLAGPAAELRSMGADRWNPSIRLVDWSAPRYSPVAEIQWERVRRKVGHAVWYFPHWDVPWHSRPERYVLTIHDLGHLRLPHARTWRRMLTRAWLERSTRYASRIAVISAHTRAELLQEWPALAAKTHVVPNGLDDAFLLPAPPLNGAIGVRVGNRPFILSIGNRKRHKNLVRGVDVLARIPDLRWVVVGEWFPDWAEVERAAEAAGVSDRLVVLDKQPDEVLRALYGAATCLFFPSRHEGFGLPILEALATGTPVVASSATAIPEVLGDQGLICDPDDANAFAQAVEFTLSAGTDEAERETRRRHARRFSWDASAERLADLIRESA